MRIRLYNNDSTDHIDYEGTIEEIRKQAFIRRQSQQWKKGWSELLEE